MKIERTPNYFSKYGECEELQRTVTNLSECLNSIKISRDEPGAASNKVKVPLADWANKAGWKDNRIVDSSIPSGISNSIYKVNLLRDIPKSECSHHHRIFVHCFFDNRQAIGTNLLRLNYAIDKFQNEEHKKGHAIALVLDEPTKGFFGWDNAVGTAEEYEFAYKHLFSNNGDKKIDFWIIRG